MIDPSLVSDAVLVRLRETWAAVGDGRIPNTAGNAYAVLDSEPGSVSDGDMDAPERDIHLRYRITAVSRDDTGATSGDGARAQAEHVSWRLRKAMLDRTNPITGTDPVTGELWEIKGRTHVACAGAMREGTTVQVVDDFELWVVAVEVAV